MARKILFEIEVENVGAARRIDALREEIKRLNKEVKGVNEGSEEYRKLTGRIAEAQIEIKDLKEEQKRLNREFQAAKFPKDSLQGLRIEYSKLTEQIKVLSAAERSSPFGQSLIRNAAGVKKEIDGIEQSIGRFTGNVGNYRSAFQGLSNVLLSIGAGFGVSEIIQQNTALSDSIANVAKTTGLTIQEAEKLAEVLKFRDTRTSLADQLKIAEIGGQLGIATDQLQAFTTGVDVLNIALGDQFGNVDLLTREFAGLRNVLTDFKTEDAANDILKLGNAVNYLEAQGNATGQSIVDFTSRIAGAGVPLGATTAQIIGLSTTLSELSINPERGATAVSRLLTEVARSPEVFAQAIGEPTAQFRKLVETDIVGALTLISERISTGSETNVAFAQTLEALGIGAQGAIEVFGKLGGSTDLLRQRIDEAGQTLQNTDSITREFSVKNNNAAAAVEKLRNAIIAAFTSSDAQDAISAIAEQLTVVVGVLGKVPGLLQENKDEVLLLAAAFIYLNRQGIIQAVPLLGSLVANFNLMTTAAGRATVATNITAAATKGLAVAQAALPMLAVIAGIYAIVKAFEAYENEASASEKATRAVADAQKEIAKETAKEVSALQRNIEVLKSETTSKQGRKKAIEELTAAYPEYLEGIDLEKAGMAQLIGLQDQLTKSIFRSAIARKQAAEDEKIVEQIINNQIKADRLRTEGLTLSEKFFQSSAELSAALLDRENEKLEEQRRLMRERFERITPQEFVIVDPGTSVKVKDLTDKTKELGDESAAAGDKIKGLGDKSAGAKQGIEAQAGSVAALKDEISKIQKQLDATAADSPAFSGLVKQLDEAKRKLKDAEQALMSSTFRALFGRELTAPTIQQAEQQPTLEVIAELQPDAEEKITQDAQEVARAVEAALRAIEFPVEIKPETEAEKIFRQQQEKGEEEARERREAADALEAENRKRRIQEIQDASITAAENTSAALAEIERNRIDRELEARITALDLETQNRIQAAGGNKTKIAAIEKDAAKKREAIEKEAARQRQQVAVKEAIINTALAIIKALPNFILAGFAAAAGALQLAVIKSQQFAGGGVVGVDEILSQAQVMGVSAGHDIKRLQPGIIRERPNAPRTAHGDNVLILAKNKEMILNEPQQNKIRSLFGQDAFALAGVPGERATRRGVPAFASGGVVGIVPQNGFAQQVSTQPVSIEARAEFSAEQVDEIGANMGTIIAAEVARQMRIGLAEGLFDANRRLEREEILNQNRQG